MFCLLSFDPLVCLVHHPQWQQREEKVKKVHEIERASKKAGKSTAEDDGLKVKPCPNPSCRIPTTKISGCMYLNCTKCGVSLVLLLSNILCVEVFCSYMIAEPMVLAVWPVGTTNAPRKPPRWSDDREPGCRFFVVCVRSFNATRHQLRAGVSYPSLQWLAKTG
jgi:hypothetical protein